MLLLSLNRKPYKASPMTPSVLTLGDLEKSKSRSLGFQSLLICAVLLICVKLEHIHMTVVLFIGFMYTLSLIGFMYNLPLRSSVYLWHSAICFGAQKQKHVQLGVIATEKQLAEYMHMYNSAKQLQFRQCIIQCNFIVNLATSVIAVDVVEYTQTSSHLILSYTAGNCGERRPNSSYSPGPQIFS